LQADLDDVQKVFDHLRDNCRVTPLTLFSEDKSTKDVPRLPPTGLRALRFGLDTCVGHITTAVSKVHIRCECMFLSRWERERCRHPRVLPQNASGDEDPMFVGGERSIVDDHGLDIIVRCGEKDG